MKAGNYINSFLLLLPIKSAVFNFCQHTLQMHVNFIPYFENYARLHCQQIDLYFIPDIYL